MVHTLAQLTGHKLTEFPMSSDTDTTELVGGFQQVSVYQPNNCDNCNIVSDFILC